MTDSFLSTDLSATETVVGPTAEELLLLASVEEAWATLATAASDPASLAALLVQVFGSSDATLIDLLASGSGLEGLNFAVASADEMQGALGAYAVVGADGSETIYLSESLLSSGDSAAILAVLLEEIGHALDTRLNGDLDTFGDEGELFAQLVLGNELSDVQLAAIQADVDSTTLTIDGVQVGVESSARPTSFSVTNIVVTGGSLTSAPVGSLISFSYSWAVEFNGSPTTTTQYNWAIYLDGTGPDDYLIASGTNQTAGLSGQLDSWTIPSGVPAGSYRITVILTKGNGGGPADLSASTVPVITVASATPSNAPPVISVGAQDASQASLNEGNSGISFGDTLTVIDSNVNDTVTASVTAISISGTGAVSRPIALTDALLLAMLTVTAGAINADAVPSPGDANNLAWNFNSGSEAFNWLGAGETFVLAYTVKAQDNSGLFDTEIVTVTITGTNDNPVLSAETGDTATKDFTESNAALTAIGTLSLTDADITDTVDVTISSLSISGTGASSAPLALDNAALKAFLSLTAGNDDNAATPGTTNNVSWSFNSGTEAFNWLAKDETLVLTYTLLATDSSGGTDTQTVTVTITGTNDNPVLSAETGDTATKDFTESNAALTAIGTLSLTDADITDTVDVTISSLSISGTGASSAPLALDNAALKAFLSLTAGNDDNAATPGTTNNVSWSFNSGTEAFNWLAKDETLVLTYTLLATDSSGGTDTQTVTVTITGTNDNPVLSAETGDTATKDFTESNAALTAIGTLSLTDADITDTVDVTISSLSISGTGASSAPLALDNAALKAFLSLTAGNDDNAATPGTTNNVSWSFNSGTEAFNWLAKDETLVLTYTLLATDSSGGTDTQTVTVTITGTNDNPVLSAETGDTATKDFTESNAALTAIGTLSLTDADITDTVDVTISSLSISGTGASSAPLALDNAALKAFLSLTAGNDDNAATPGTTNNVSWSFNSGTEAFNWLAKDETLVLTYTLLATDSSGGTDTQTVTVTITGTNDNPVLSAETGDTATKDFTESNAALTAIGTLSLTDADITDTVDVTISSLSISGTGASSAPLALDNAALKAFLSLTAGNDDNAATPGTTNNVSWSFNSGTEAFNWLAKDETLVLTYTLLATDSSGGTDTQTVTVTITGTNDNPVLSAETGDTATKDFTESNAALTAIGTLSLTDADITDTVDVTISSLSISGTGASSAPLALDNAALKAFLSLTAGNDDNAATPGTTNNVSWSFNSGTEAFNWLAKDETLVLTYTLLATDSSGGTDTQTVTVTITGTNDNPVLSAETGDTATKDFTESNAALTAIGTLSLTDADITDTVDVTISSLSISGTGASSAPLALDNAALKAFLSLTAGNDDNAATPGTTNNVSWSFNSGTEAFNWLAKDETLVLTYTLLATDSSGGTDTQTVTVTITGTNDNPVLSAETGDTATKDFTESNAALTAIGTLSLTDADITDTVDVTISSLSISGTGASSAPLALDNAALKAFLSLTAGNDDNAATPGTTNNVSWSFNSGTEAFNWLAKDETLVLTYTLLATDSSGGTDTQTVTVTITGTNDNPVLSAETGDTATKDFTESNAALTAIGTLSLTDADITDTVDVTISSLSISGTGASSAPLALDNAALKAFLSLTAGNDDNAATPGTTNNVSWSFNSGTEAFNWLAKDETLVLTYTLLATDSSGGTDTQTVTVTITGTNDNPIVVKPPTDNSIALIRVSKFSFDFPGDLFADPDLSDQLTYSLKLFFDFDGDGDQDLVNPADYGFKLDGLNLSGEPSKAGLYRVEITADDGKGGKASYSYQFSVMEPVRFGNGDLDQIDFSSADGQQFRLIWTPFLAADGTMKYKLSATNSGNFALGVAVDSTISRGFVVDLPELASGVGGFQLRDGSSISVYQSVAYDELGGLVYEGEPLVLSAGQFSYKSETGQVTIRPDAWANFNQDADSLVYFVFKLEFEIAAAYASGISATTDLVQNSQTSETEFDAFLGTVQVVDDLEALSFNVAYVDNGNLQADELIGGSTVYADNEFKNARSFNGILDKDAFEDLISNYGVNIAQLSIGLRRGAELKTSATVFDLDPKLTGTQTSVAIDQDGWFMSNYVHSGSTATYTAGVTVSSFNQAFGGVQSAGYIDFMKAHGLTTTTLDRDSDGLVDFTETQFDWGGKVKMVTQLISSDLA